MKNENLTFDKVLAVFQDYLAKDDHVEVIETSRGYAVIEWDDRMENWAEIEHCPLPVVLVQILLNTMASFRECGFTAGKRDVTEKEKNHIAAELASVFGLL